MSKELVGYKVKKTLLGGKVLPSDNPDIYFEPIYRDKEPLKELADYARQYAHYRNDMELADRIEKLIKKLQP